MKKTSIFLIGFIIIFLLLKVDSESIYNILYKINKVEEKALNGDKKAIGKAFMYYIFETHQYKKGELFFRNLEKQGVSIETSRGYLGLILVNTLPQNRKRYIEGLACLKQSGNNNKKIFQKELREPRFNIDNLNIENYRCNK